MTLLNTINVGGTDFKVAGVAILGSCPTPAGSEVKVCAFTDDFELKAGDMLLVKFTYANTYGDGSTTYPKLQVNGTNYTMRRADGSYITAGEWDSNATLTFLFDGTDFILPVGSRAMSYSTEEVATGKKWIDGKDIYRKSIVATGTETLQTTVLNTVPSWSIRPDNIDKVIHYETQNAQGYYNNVILYDDPNNQYLQFMSINVSVTINSGDVLTLEYTKTTSST